MSRIVELPEDVYDGLVKAAEARGLAPAEWIAAKLPKTKFVRTEEQNREERRRWLDIHTFDAGRPLGTDNDQIDADLAREYGSSHELS